MTIMRVGFLPLVDAALPILAREFGYAEDEGISLELVRDMSWATVCDRLLYGHSDAAHMIAPLTIAMTLGLGRPAQSLSTPFVLGLNGNAVTMRRELAEKLTADGGSGDLNVIGKRLADFVKSGEQRLRFGVVHRHSSHNYMLRYWLSGVGINVDKDVDIVTIAPPFASEALALGEIDAICVGEPWNSVAVDRGVGVIIGVTSQIWRRGVEKVLAMRTERLEGESEPVRGLIRALYRAGEAFIDSGKADAIATLLARPEYLDGSKELIKGAVTDNILFAQGSERVHVPDFMFQHRDAANFPWRSQAAWLYAQMCLAGHVDYSREGYALAQNTFRPDIFRAAFAGTNVPLPGASAKVEGGLDNVTGVGAKQGLLSLGPDRFFDHRTFDPDNIEAYLAEARHKPA